MKPPPPMPECYIPITPIQNTVATSYHQLAPGCSFEVSSSYRIGRISAFFEGLEADLAADAALGRNGTSVTRRILLS